MRIEIFLICFQKIDSTLCFFFLKCRLGFEIAVSIVIEEKSEEIIIIKN